MAPSPMPEPLVALLRERLKHLKKQASLSDIDIARAMNELAPAVTAYQQKVNDFFSGEMKRPDLDFTAALCAALGVKLSDLLTSIERGAQLQRDPDWEWLMFGRQLGPAGRTAAREFVDGVRPGRAGAAKRARTTRRKRAAVDG